MPSPVSNGQVVTAYMQQQMLSNYLASVTAGNFSGILVGVKAALIAAAFAPNPQSTFTSFTEASFTGYAESGTITFATPILQPDGFWATIGSEVSFTVGSSPSVTNTIYGVCFYAVVSSVKTALWFEMFSTPVIMNLAGNTIMLIPQFAPPGVTDSLSVIIT